MNAIALWLFKALADYLLRKGLLKAEERKRIEEYKKQAEKYEESISKPDETLEDRLNATDDFMR